MSHEQLVWFITGTTTGLGRYIALAALPRGDCVIATARPSSLSKIDDLKAQGADVLELDVSASYAVLEERAQVAVGVHGRIDVLVNNAGIAQVAAYEEINPGDTFELMNTNLLGAMNLTHVFLPYMRKARRGTVLWIGSLRTWCPIPGLTNYAASKGAMRAFSECLDCELSPLGLRSIVVEFGRFQTQIVANAALPPSRIADYDATMAPVRAGYQALLHEKHAGDPEKGAQVVVYLIHDEGIASGKILPPVLGLGTDYYRGSRAYCENMLRVTDEWKDVTCSTDLDVGP